MQTETWPITRRLVVTGWQITFIGVGSSLEIIYQVGYTIQNDIRRWLLAHILRDKKKMLNRVRRIRGQVESIEHAIEREADCSEILHTISACRGAFNSLMAEVLDGHIRFHVMDPDHDPTSEKARAAQELIDVLRAYLR
jgi:DNA-binding FrmR family transcriptional regulator